MYDRNYWKDHVTDQTGAVIQQGTLLDQQHHNKMELGICDSSLAANIRTFASMQQSYENDSEAHTVTLTGNGSEWPFNNTQQTIALSALRNSKHYTVEIDVTGYSGGRLGNIRISDKALNGFKLLHDGSATTVNLTLKIRGGMTA